MRKMEVYQVPQRHLHAVVGIARIINDSIT
jgi:hypothetical protein